MTGFYEALALGKGREVFAASAVDGPYAKEKVLYEVRGEELSALSFEPEFFRNNRPLFLTCMQDPSFSGAALVHAEEGRVFLEMIPGNRSLIICGAGHVALALVRMAALLEFEITVIDDRREFTEKAEQAGAHHVLCMPFEEALDLIPGDHSSCFVIMTRDHRHDVECLHRILKKPRAYLGMMGSRHRTVMIRESFLAQNIDVKAQGLHMPIGLSIASETPAEIAVSILSEIILTLNSRGKGIGYSQQMLDKLEALEQGRGETDAVLAVIIEKKGEGPRNPGTKMTIFNDGRLLGTVGGGFAEAETIKKAKAMLESKDDTAKAESISIALDGRGEDAMDCGGTITVTLERYAA